MGRCTPATWERHVRLAERILHAVEDLPAMDFSPADMLDRRAMLANLRETLLNDKTLERWRNDPQTHLQTAADAIHGLLVRHADDLAPVAEPMLNRLHLIPRFLDDAAECLHRPDPLWQRLTVKAAPAVGEMFLSLVDPLAAASGRAKGEVQRLAERAAAATRRYADHAAALEPAPEGSFALGEERFTLLIRDRLGLAWSPREAEAVALRLAAELRHALREEARRFHPTREPAEVLAGLARQWRPAGDDLMAVYRATTEEVRQRFVEADWMSFPEGDRLLIQPVPGFMRDQFPTAAYSSPGALDPDQTGIFWVNDLGAEAGSAAKRRAEQAQHFGLELTCAHEAYPGHHLQYLHQNAIPSLARRMAHHAIYYEGWTLWCEQMTADLMGDDPDRPWLRLAQLHDALWRAWRIVIDCGLQTGRLRHEGAARVLMREVGFTRARAEGDVNWYTAAPGVAMSYLLGKMELLRLKRARVDRGGWSLREFNDWTLSFGAIPWRWIEESGL
jgi:uncharacterized protein (DUF885 family)